MAVIYTISVFQDVAQDEVLWDCPHDHITECSQIKTKCSCRWILWALLKLWCEGFIIMVNLWQEEAHCKQLQAGTYGRMIRTLNWMKENISVVHFYSRDYQNDHQRRDKASAITSWAKHKTLTKWDLEEAIVPSLSIRATSGVGTSAANRLIGEVVQSHRRRAVWLA